MLFSKELYKWSLVAGIGSFATTSLALVDAEVFYGSQTSDVNYTSGGERKSTTSSGTEAGATVIIKPLPFVPMSIGATVSQSTINFNKIAKIMADEATANPLFSGYSTDATAMSRTLFYGPVVKLWVPVPIITPYVKAAYLLGTETLDTNFTLNSPASAATTTSFELKSKTVYSHTASSIAAGIGYSPIKFTDIFVEYAMHSGKRKATGASGTSTTTIGDQSVSTPITTGDIPADDKKDVDANSTSIRLGVSVGI